jgi:hypothetical protein
MRCRRRVVDKVAKTLGTESPAAVVALTGMRFIANGFQPAQVLSAGYAAGAMLSEATGLVGAVAVTATKTVSLLVALPYFHVAMINTGVCPVLALKGVTALARTMPSAPTVALSTLLETYWTGAVSGMVIGSFSMLRGVAVRATLSPTAIVIPRGCISRRYSSSLGDGEGVADTGSLTHPPRITPLPVMRRANSFPSARPEVALRV